MSILELLLNKTYIQPSKGPRSGGAHNKKRPSRATLKAKRKAFKAARKLHRKK